MSHLKLVHSLDGRQHPLERYRKRHGLTQKAMGDLLGLSHVSIWRIEQGSQPVSAELAKRIEQVTSGEVFRLAALYPTEYGQ